jgi:predicted AAA+ superfamily ATPase
MASPAAFDRLVADFQEWQVPAVTTRTVKLPALRGKADVVAGMRRSGKTWLLFQRIREILASGVVRRRILYVNFEDDRLLPLSPHDLDLLLDAFYRRFPENRNETCWLLLDEIHAVPEWQRFVRRALDSQRLRLILTGSSAKLLGREIATSLRGRSLTTELLPFSFEEAVRHTGIALPSRWPPPASLRSRLEHEMDAYLERGGFPEVQALAPDLRLRVLQDYVHVVLLRDVVERHEIANPTALRRLARHLLGAPGGRFSIHKFHRDLRSQGIPVGKDTLHAYLGHLEDAFLVFPVEIAARSERRRTVNPRTCYVIDPGLARASSFRAAADLGHLLENVVYLELRRRGHAVHYVVTERGEEVDFLAVAPDGTEQLIQVCADLSELPTRARELRAMDAAMKERRLKRGTVVSLREEESVPMARGSVDIVPAWRWLLERE